MLDLEQNMTLETEIKLDILKTMGLAYVLFKSDGSFLNMSDKAYEIIWNIGLVKTHVNTFKKFREKLSLYQIKSLDSGLQSIANKEPFQLDGMSYICIYHIQDSYILALSKKDEKGSFVLFKDITNEYEMVSSSEICTPASKMVANDEKPNISLSENAINKNPLHLIAGIADTEEA